MHVRSLLSLAAAALVCLAGPAGADPAAAAGGYKLDSGLGELPHYRAWADPRGGRAVLASVAGESLDSGLGELLHYRTWADPRGGRAVLASVAGESLDSGLGELAHYRTWADRSGKNPVRAAAGTPNKAALHASL